jgi:hypothetical protein
MGRYDDDEDTPATSEEVADSSPDEDADVANMKSAARRVIRRGWGAAEETRSADSPYANRLKVATEEQVIKFLEDDPYTSYRQHWIDREGQKSFTCISNLHPKGCPLCDAGDRPSARFSFNVVVLAPGEEPVLRSYEVGPRVVDQLKNLHQSDKTGPLPRHYWAVSRSGKGSTSQTNHQVVKEADLEDDWGIEALTSAQIADFKSKAYDPSIVSIPSYKTLQSLAAEELGA